jgi:hypothetical protein
MSGKTVKINWLIRIEPERRKEWRKRIEKKKASRSLRTAGPLPLTAAEPALALKEAGPAVLRVLWQKPETC